MLHALLLALAKRAKLRLAARLKVRIRLGLHRWAIHGFASPAQTFTGAERLLTALLALLAGAIDFRLLLDLAVHPLQERHPDDDPVYQCRIHGSAEV